MSKRYLFIRLTALGDIVFALEALLALLEAEPDAEVDWVVEDRWDGLLAAQPRIRRRIVYPRRELSRRMRRPWLWPALFATGLGHLRELRRGRYDAVLELQGNLKGGVHARLARGKRRIGFAAPRAREGSSWLVRERVALPEPRPHRETEGRALVARLLGRDAPASERPLFEVSEEAAERVAAWCREQWGEETGPLVVLAPGTSEFAAFKRWPTARFTELARALRERGNRVAVSAGPGERELALASGVAAGHAALFDGSAHGLPAYLALLSRAEVLVAADSAPLHLAQAVGTKVVAMFGPKDPDVYGPWRGRAEILRYDVPCAPCGRRSCDLPVCVQGIPSEAALAAVERLLAEAACA